MSPASRSLRWRWLWQVGGGSWCPGWGLGCVSASTGGESPVGVFIGRSSPVPSPAQRWQMWTRGPACVFPRVGPTGPSCLWGRGGLRFRCVCVHAVLKGTGVLWAPCPHPLLSPAGVQGPTALGVALWGTLLPGIPPRLRASLASAGHRHALWC